MTSLRRAIAVVLAEDRAAEMAAAQALIDAALADERQLTTYETIRIESHIAEVRALDARMVEEAREASAPGD